MFCRRLLTTRRLLLQQEQEQFQQKKTLLDLTRRETLLNYHMPDIDPLKLSNKDPLLASLDLKHLDKEATIQRHKLLEARGKNVRYSVDGKRKAPESKKKKR